MAADAATYLDLGFVGPFLLELSSTTTASHGISWYTRVTNWRE